jgi:hypothetical protein
MAAAYATPADLAAWLETDPPADADRLLRRASDLLDATVYGAYAVDAGTGLPADPAAAAALRDAACAQVEFWVEVGEAHDLDGGAGSQVSIGGLAMQRPGRPSGRALDLLRMAGLMNPWRSA